MNASAGPLQPRDLVERACFYAILDTGWVARGQWSEKCRQLINGGAGIIQLRAKKESPAERAALLDEILPLFAETDIPLIINDDIDLCLQHPGLGLHIGQDDLPAREARERLGPDRILGLSTHSIDQAKAAIALGPDILTYFAVGPVFATATKPDYIPVGLPLVKEVAVRNPPLPFFCIGGITRENISSVRSAGARRVVIVSDVLTAADTAAAVRDVTRQMTE